MNLISDRFANDGKASLYISELQRDSIKQFEEKCRSGEYKLIKRECECGCGDFEVIAQKDRYGIAVDTVICRNCGLIMTNPCLDDSSNTSFYKKDYPYIYRAVDKPSEKAYSDARKDAESILEFIQKHTGMYEGSVLEIGCADGRNVVVFAENGYDVCGIDLSAEYVEFGKSKGLNLICEDAEAFERRGKKFDLIVLNHVLEHFTDLGRELSVIRRMLKKDGWMYVGAPGVKALSYGTYKGDFLLMLQNAHIFNFTKATLCRTMKKHGFDTVFCNEGIYGVFRNGEPGIIEGNAYEETLEYLRGLEDIRGDRELLLQDRVNRIVKRYGKGEVLLYGTASEMDAFVQKIDDLTPISGFFYSDKKSAPQVIEYIRAAAGKLKCLLIMDAAGNERLLNAFTTSFGNGEMVVYSAYTEVF